MSSENQTAPFKKFNILLKLLLFLIIVAVFALIVYLINSSLFLQKRTTRITIGVLDKYPYVVSYDKTTGIAHVIGFASDAYVNIPGGYQWYRLSAIQLLGSIEKNQYGIVKRTFEELVGAPIDYVFIPKKVYIQPKSSKLFTSYYLSERKKITSLFNSKYKSSIKNPIDLYFAAKALRVRKDKLVFVDAVSAVIYKKKQKRYIPEKLDTFVKGFLYRKHQDIGSVHFVIYSEPEDYTAAKRISRIIEGTGIKVLDIAQINKNINKCEIITSRRFKNSVYFIANHFKCIVNYSNEAPYTRGTIHMYLDNKLAIIYK